MILGLKGFKKHPLVKDQVCHNTNGLIELFPNDPALSLHPKALGQYSPTILKIILCLFLQKWVNLKVTQLLTG